MNASEHLEELAWKTPDSYFGFNPVGDYCILSRNRDSCLLDECNWEVAHYALGATMFDSEMEFDERPATYSFCANHWAVGWVEFLMVRPDAPEHILKEAGEIICALADYPILDEDLHSRREWEAIREYWASCSVSERADYLYEVGISIFAARRDTLPEDPHGRLYERLREGL